MKNFKWALPAMILGLGFVFATQPSAANPNYTKKTGRKCLYCHVGEWSSGKYTEAGEYFKEHNTLKDFIPKEQTVQQSGAQKKNEAKQ